MSVSQNPIPCPEVNPPFTLEDQYNNIPIYPVRQEFINLIQKHQVVIVKGETGSGKSTQIPKYLAAAGYTKDGKCIAVTQPRRIAAKSLAARVSTEIGTEMGNLVGYAFRFDKCFSPETVIKYVTDGLLIREAARDPNLNQYSVVMIDEAHERSIYTDLCFGLLKRICKSRPNFKVVISSATLEEQAFSQYFDNAPIFTVPGRAFPVEIMYDPKLPGFYVNGACDTIIKICQTKSQGDILVFLAGVDDIEAVEKMLNQRLPSIQCLLIPKVVPFHASLPFKELQSMFDKSPSGYRKIILATTIAETALTIEGMDFVVDCGYFKQNCFDSHTKIESLVKQRITKFQAIQRAGRAGRIQPGKCYRLYSENDLNSFLPSPIPEIERVNLQNVVLDIIAMGFSNPMEFDFITKPSASIIAEAVSYLKQLSALDKTGNITDVGKLMGKFPLEPQLTKALIQSVESGCCNEVMKIVAMLCTQYIHIFQYQQFGSASAKTEQFTTDSDGDHITLLKVYNGWVASNRSEQWCKEHQIDSRILEEADEILGQLREIIIANGLTVIGTGEMGTEISAETKRNILETFLTGYSSQVAVKQDHGQAYTILSSEESVTIQDLFLHPYGALYSKRPPPRLVMFHYILKTSKPYLRGSSEVTADMLMKFALDGFFRLNLNDF